MIGICNEISPSIVSRTTIRMACRVSSNKLEPDAEFGQGEVENLRKMKENPTVAKSFAISRIHLCGPAACTSEELILPRHHY